VNWATEGDYGDEWLGRRALKCVLHGGIRDESAQIAKSVALARISLKRMGSCTAGVHPDKDLALKRVPSQGLSPAFCP